MASCRVISVPSFFLRTCFELHLGSEQKNIDGPTVEFFKGFLQPRHLILYFLSQRTPNASWNCSCRRFKSMTHTNIEIAAVVDATNRANKTFPYVGSSTSSFLVGMRYVITKAIKGIIIPQNINLIISSVRVFIVVILILNPAWKL
jgi:hypothetical protein